MKIEILDCTLRDGAYVINSNFGENKIRNIIKSLQKTKIEIIECGWLKNCIAQKDSVFYASPADLEKYITEKTAKYALMFDYGKFELENLPQSNGLVDIIRIAFYKENMKKVFSIIEKIKNKGYEVFLQPSNILDYKPSEIIDLCKMTNAFGVNSVYIVDTFGSMFPEDLNKIFPIINSEVEQNITLGFHAHNSIQLAFALSMQFIEKADRDIIVDGSMCGIGRGAGNTKTELLVEYLNRAGKDYDINALWQGIKESVEPLYENYNWEYTPEKAYKGINLLHPNTLIGEIS